MITGMIIYYKNNKIDPIDLYFSKLQIYNSYPYIDQMTEFEQQLVNYKTIIIGRSAVGKSTLLLRYVDGTYNPQKPTIGIDYRFKKVTQNNTTFNLQLWDSAGQQRYRTIVYNYFSLSKAACVVFDLTNQQSLSDAKTWMQQLVMHCGNDIPKLLIGNKSDLLPGTKLQQQLEQYKQTIQQMKKQYKCQFFAVSALSGQNVAQAFAYLTRQIYQKNMVEQKQKPKMRIKKSGENLSVMKKKTRQSQLQTGGKKGCCG